nr:MAG TPA: endopeptidase tail [Caudoviricetes sp.]
MYEIYGYPFGNPDSKLLIYQPGNHEALVLSPKLTREVSKGGSLTFTMPRDHPQYDKLQKMSTVVAVLQDGKEIWRGRILNHEADWYNRRAIYCEGALSYFNDSCVTPFNYKGNLKQFFQHLVDAHNAQVQAKMKQFEVGTVTAALGNREVQFGDADKYGVGEDYGSIWEIIDKMVLKVFGGYIYCTFNADTGKNVLNYCDQAVEEKRQVNQEIRYGVNLLDLTEKTDTNDLFTRIYPVGNKHTVKTSKWYYKLLWWKKDLETEHEERYGIMDTTAATVSKYLPAGWNCDLKQGYIQNDAAIEKFGVVAKIREQDTDSDNDTFAAGVQDLQQNWAMVTSYTVKAVDLVDAGEKLDRLTFASYAHIISEPHGVDAIMLCTKLTEPLDRPDKKEFNFGMTRRTLTDRQAANLGRTNLLEEQAATSSNASGGLLEQLKSTNKNLSDYKTSNDAAVAEAAKTATNFLEWSPTAGLTVRHESLPGKKVQITSDGVKVISGSGMVNIWSSGISITDGAGSCSISSGAITFHGIKNNLIYVWEYETDSEGNLIRSFAPQTTKIDLSAYSSVLLIYDTYKKGTWFASGGSAGKLSVVLPVNGQTSSFAYPWNTVHWREITVSSTGITFGSGYERTSSYSGTPVLGIWSFNLQNPGGDGRDTNNAVCRPLQLYGFM